MKIKLIIPIVMMVASFAGIIVLVFVLQPEPQPVITQQELRMMVEEWMDNPDEDDTKQRLEIMKAYYTFLESGQEISLDTEGLVLQNQIRKMVSLDIPKEELDELREQVREELRTQGFEI